MLKKEILELIYNYLLENDNANDSSDIVTVSGAVISPEDIYATINTALDGWFTEGKKCAEFSSMLEKQVGVRNAILCNSGSSANLLAVTALKEHYKNKDGMKVITNATGFPTTIAPIVQNNLIPLFVDCDLQTLNVKSYEIAALPQSDDVAGIILAHTLGFPYDSRFIAKTCKKFGRWFVEDCCDALGAKIYDIPVGSFGDVSTHSFFPAHQITTGEGGAVLTNNNKLAKVISSYNSWGRNCWCKPGQDNTCGKRFNHNIEGLPHGWDHKYTFSRLGYNLKMTELQGALGVSQLSNLNFFVKRRLENFKFLYENLIDLASDFDLVEIPHWATPSPFGFPIIIMQGISRIKFVDYLEQAGIRTRPIFAGNITRQPMMKNVNYDVHGTLLNSDYIMNNAFWIGCHPGLSKKKLEYVVDKIFELTAM